MRAALMISMRQMMGYRSYWTADPARVEDVLRTHMVNGTTPEELEASAEAWERKFNELSECA